MIDYKTASKEQLKAEMKRLSSVVSDTPFGTKKEFFHLPEILNTDEQPIAIASGMMDNNTWLITLTNKRVIFLDKGMIFGVKQVDVNLDNIVSVGGKTGLIFGEIMISTSGQNYTIKNVMKSCVIPFTNLINETRNRPAQATNIDSHSPKASLSFDEQMAKIERLADMKEEGMLTDEEFQQQKQRILNG
ncbi:PH domain-containing protein [Pluralibacter gergoviae]|uniref:PH domain-containing protein n=1 Tax=Pluralibacter gergoviae TaxID=61647 RepID=A0AAI9DPY7_PLUGE|nr:PH domain-containing protein [Pluralibacter gergoviae]EKV0917673.1 PH domain-containing protein [Pluralibacter gergoviae]EKV9910700.1 PH domain-containing protein [Pluralibacter gergoviae]EKW7275909.1 PH domain-containing protein [Pluralibacter gergoviae]ELD4298090.1 PH domain-containing protein [Pluralibacter gergoviae]ELD4308835.1 PH domain-containing protein [Pluralibacter gergoviae]